MGEEGAALPGLFLISLLAATILPAQSEVMLVGLLLAGTSDPWTLTLVASIGNTAGSCINWALGRWLRRFAGRRWFAVPEAALLKAEAVFRRWGLPSLLLAWTPVLGDPLTVVAGSLRVPFGVFLLLVAIGKAGRYILLTLGTLGLM
ncbi:MAG: hypothetical protein RLY86_2725 [Pseudomonadota bacterium]|jgi:membrane protein YqaA with SNARE-associated domain